MYADIPFRMLPLTYVEEYPRRAQADYASFTSLIDRVYFVGGDPFALSARHILERMDLVRSYLPNVQVFTMYARIDNVRTKSDLDLQRLHEKGLDDLYLGVECGLNDVLDSLNKGYSVEEIKTQCQRLNAASIRHCDLLMVGTAGQGRGLECAKATARLENAIFPHKILLTTMSAFAGTKLDADIQKGTYQLASERENLEEERAFIADLNLPDCYVWASHPLDTVKIEGLLGKEKTKMLDALSRSIAHGNFGSITRRSRIGTL